MKRVWVLRVLAGVLVLVLLAVVACAKATPTSTPKPTATATAVPTATPTATPKPGEPTWTPMPTWTSVPTATSKPTPTATKPAAGTPDAFTMGKRGGHLKQGVVGFAAKWDLTQLAVWYSTEAVGKAYSGLLQFSPRDGLTPIPDLAESWEFSAAADSVILTIREGVKWHDGKPLTMEDIVYSLNRWIDPPSAVPQPRVGGFLAIEEIKPLGEHTLQINLTAPKADFVLDLADGWHIIVPKHVVEPAGGAINDPELIIGTGPFVLKDWERDSWTRWEANPDYFLKAPDGDPYPLLDEITTIHFGADEDAMKGAFMTGQIDIASPMNAGKAWGIKQDLGDKVVFEEWRSPGLGFGSFNGEKPPFDEFKARKAVHLVIDRIQLAEILSVPGLPAPNQKPVSFFGTADPFLDEVVTYPGYNPDTREQDLAEAKRLAEEVGLKEFELLTGHTSTYVNEAQLIKQQMEEIGITVTIKSMDTTAARSLALAGDFVFHTESRAVAYPNPLSFVDQMYMPGAGSFSHGPLPPQNWLDVLAEARITPPGSKLNDMIKEMDRIMREEWIPKIATTRSNEYKMAYLYVKNMDGIPAFKFNQCKQIDAWLDK